MRIQLTPDKAPSDFEMLPPKPYFLPPPPFPLLPGAMLHIFVRVLKGQWSFKSSIHIFLVKWFLHIWILVNLLKNISKGVNIAIVFKLQLSIWLNKMHHRCFHEVLKFLEQLTEHLQMDDSAVVKDSIDSFAEMPSFWIVVF